MYEKNMNKKIKLLLEFGKTQKALKLAISDSQDPNNINFVISSILKTIPVIDVI
jgi:hypothetical protein